MSDDVENNQRDGFWAKTARDAQALVGTLTLELDMANQEIERLRATIADDAAVIGRLNSGEELQAIMKINNDLRAKIVQLHLVAGAVSLESPSYDDIRKEIKVTFCTEVDSSLAKELK